MKIAMGFNVDLRVKEAVKTVFFLWQPHSFDHKLCVTYRGG